MKKMLSMIIAATFTVGLAAPAAMAADKVMKCGIVTNKDRSLSKGLVEFGKILEKETGGTIKVQVFTDGVLGGDRQTLEGLQMGTIHCTSVSTGPIAAFVPQFDVFDLPFLFKDKATAFKVADGPIGKELLDKLPAVGMIGFNYWENGFRHLTNNKREVKTLEDIKGLKIRTLESKIHVDTWKQLGANPTPMSFSQLYTALEQGVVDGQENPYGNVVSNKFNEVQKYLTTTGHVYNASPFLVSKKFYDGLTDKEKEAVKKAAKEAQTFQRLENDKEDTVSAGTLQARGMKITALNPGEQQKVVAALKPVYDKYSETLGKDLVARMLAAVK
ncbi:DctP family TRAP transporter solute-binding subunit [Propionivibrio dicarboxylicus]|uniref:Tripartite ATP-independent transporter solute receptor, DctP family n=1 Tax=Propionivibrio dicarboxylicus TaxID=83767 RepID=A0A1G8A523_9RHOO|nr:DctP family TRAP transporter solute-binding subunit [Propionivibrio dicarboxylicus]SDH15971.1 tripartite ATP-independent transporter solute receptor, DctP family [Propionivibrio dicarboxylicus]